MDQLRYVYKPKRKYSSYNKDKKLVSQMLDFFKNNDKESYILADVSKKVNVPIYILSNWRKKLEEDPSYVPGARIGQHKRLFTTAQELTVADFIRVQFINPGVMLRRKHLRNVLFTLWQSLDLEHRANVPKKFVSRHFLKDFCRRQGFSFRQMRKKKRTDIDETEVDVFIQEYMEIFSDYPFFRIVNMDETPFNYVFLRGQVLAEKGKEEVDAKLPDDYRKSFTAIASITADGKKLPPIFLATGKSPRSMQQFDGMSSKTSDYELFYSEGGNTDEKAMIHYLQLLHIWMKSFPCALVLDRYASHETEAVKQKAKELDIRLVYIPTSATDKFQPLDRRVFGVLKSKASKEFDNFVFDAHRGFTKPEAADLFVRTWREIGENIVKKAWNLEEMLDDDDDPEDSDFEPEDNIEEEDISDLSSEGESEGPDEDDLIIIRELSHQERLERARLTPPRPLH